MQSTKEKKFITTPIYYVNDRPHIGHAYTTMASDALARYFRLRGHEVFFLTGTDEHGQKIQRSAEERGKTPQAYADEVSAHFRALWDHFQISYDHFIRTTDEKHKKTVQYAFEKMYRKGDIYKGEYEGHYCVSCETFITALALKEQNGHCPECGKPTIMIKEESYFFALSKYAPRLLEWYEKHPDCILPVNKKNEVIRFVQAGLQDLSITRTSFSWGIPIPDCHNQGSDCDHHVKHVMYVWLDALLNYVSALGYGDDEKNLSYWPASYHFLGKDILRFHAVYWPAFLMSLDLPLPKHLATHGWWTRDGVKMSKSLGNVIDPKEVSDAYGNEPFRYFLLREVPFGQDGDFSQQALIDRINADLSNTLGNLISRTASMAKKFFNASLSSSKEEVQSLYGKEKQEVDEILKTLPALFEQVALHRYLEELWKIFMLGNTAIAQYEPWKMMKEGKQQEAMALLVLVGNILLKGLIALLPIMPQSVARALEVFEGVLIDGLYDRLIVQGEWEYTLKLKEIPPLFPRLTEALLPEQKSEPQKPKAQEKTETSDENLIDINTFFKSQIRVGCILSASRVPKSDKLLKLEIDLGEAKPRQIIAGIGKYYEPDSLVGEQVCVVANLKPAKLMGMMSEGMVLAAKDENGLSLIKPFASVKNGASVG